jgi:spore coat protein U-like protein
MPTVRQLCRIKLHHALWLALAMHGMNQTDATPTAFAASNAKSFAVSASVTRRCSVAVDLSNSENLNRGENKSGIAARLDQAVTIACSRGGIQNVRIGNGSNAEAKLIPLSESVKQKLLIEDARMITVDF